MKVFALGVEPRNHIVGVMRRQYVLFAINSMSFVSAPVINLNSIFVMIVVHIIGLMNVNIFVQLVHCL